MYRKMKTVVKRRNRTDRADETQALTTLGTRFSFPSRIPSPRFISLLYFGEHTNSAADTFLFDLNKNESRIPVQMKAGFLNTEVGVSFGRTKV